MDTINRNILAKINSSAQKGAYIILSEEDFKETLGTQIDGESISNACKELSNEGYIDLKYAGGGMFCVAPLKDFVAEPEPEFEEDEREVVVVRTGTAAAFFAALLGGALGSIIVSLIISVI
ncbi:MAG: hypothetical protein J1G07_04645 [Clostridiales bacterium]|nr:hypothetical protein [Clostridiales bacterium]